MGISVSVKWACKQSSWRNEEIQEQLRRPDRCSMSVPRS